MCGSHVDDGRCSIASTTVAACSFAKQQGQWTRLWWFDVIGSSLVKSMIFGFSYVFLFSKFKSGPKYIDIKKKCPTLALTDA